MAIEKQKMNYKTSKIKPVPIHKLKTIKSNVVLDKKREDQLDRSCEK